MGKARTIYAPKALLREGWADDVIISIDENGIITGLDSYKELPNDHDADVIEGVLIPGMINAHSLSFQHVLTGLTERRSPSGRDNFWNWRDTMYRFIGDMTPETLHDITTYVYMEMLKAGYTSVSEFFYLHNAPNGKPYKNKAEMSHAVITAALESGIALLHLPSFYQQGSMNGAPLNETQKRFFLSLDDCLSLIEHLKTQYQNNPLVSIGFAPHSLRAIGGDILKEAVQSLHKIYPHLPIHIHASEQADEVAMAKELYKMTPIEWLYHHIGLDKNWTIIHASEAQNHELDLIAKQKATICLCPSAEANMADDIFDLSFFLERGGHFAIGSGHCGEINPFAELRAIEYAERRQHKRRAILYSPDITSIGANLYDQALKGGIQATSRLTGMIDINHVADFVVIDDSLPIFYHKIRDHLLDTAVFGQLSQYPVRDVMVQGRWQIKNRVHKREDVIKERYLKALSSLVL